MKAAAVLTALTLAACAPGIPTADTAPDTAAHEAQRRPVAPDIRKDVTPRVSRSKPRTLPGIAARIRWCESRGSYTAKNARSSASGAYQLVIGTSNAIARRWGRSDLVGIPAATWSVRDQDAAFAALYAQRGTQPWQASRRCWA